MHFEDNYVKLKKINCEKNTLNPTKHCKELFLHATNYWLHYNSHLKDKKMKKC